MLDVKQELKELYICLNEAKKDLNELEKFKKEHYTHNTLNIRFHISSLNLYIKELNEAIYFYEN